MATGRETESGAAHRPDRAVSRRPGLAPVTWLGEAPPEPSEQASPADGSSEPAVSIPGEEQHGSTASPQHGTTASERRARRAENVSMRALTRRGMSRHELERTLVSRELEPAEVEAELERLEAVGLIDDASLADTIVRTQHERKGLGRSALVAELRRRHIDQEHIEAALEQVGEDDEAQRARELAERRAPQLRSVDHDTAVRRLTGYLMRKGYGASVVRTAVAEALADGHGRSSPVRFR